MYRYIYIFIFINLLYFKKESSLTAMHSASCLQKKKDCKISKFKMPFFFINIILLYKCNMFAVFISHVKIKDTMTMNGKVNQQENYSFTN